MDAKNIDNRKTGYPINRDRQVAIKTINTSLGLQVNSYRTRTSYAESAYLNTLKSRGSSLLKQLNEIIKKLMEDLMRNRGGTFGCAASFQRGLFLVFCCFPQFLSSLFGQCAQTRTGAWGVQCFEQGCCQAKIGIIIRDLIGSASCDACSNCRI